MGIQDFFRMRNVFGGPQPGYKNQNQAQAPLPSRPIPDMNRYYDENIDVYPEEPSALDALKRNVMNPPSMPFEYPKNVNAGLEAALKIAAEPSPLEKNRVYVDGQAYQKNRVITDAEGKKRYVTDVKEPSFMEQVMRAMPAAVSPAADILNAQAQRPIAEWEMRNKGLATAANIEKTEESNRALAAQRYAQAQATPEKLDIQRQGVNVRAYDAETKRQLAGLHDLSDSEKIKLLQEGKVSIQNLKDAAELSQIGAKGEQERQTEGVRQTGRKELEGVRQEGREEIQGVRGKQALEQIGARGEQSRQTKVVAPGGAGATSQLPTQQKVGLQLKANQAIQDHPEWEAFISVNPNTGMVEVESPSKTWYGGTSGPDQETYDAMVAYLRGTTPASSKPLPKPPTNVAKPAAPAAQAAGKQESITKTQRNKNTGETRTMVSTDGGKTWNVVKK